LNAIKVRDKYNTIKNSLTGQDCFIVGSGPSLIGFDFSILDNRYTIGINHVVEHYDNLNCLIYADRIFLKSTSYDLHNFKGKIFASEKTIYQPEIQDLLDKDNFYVFDDNRSCISFDIVKDGLFHPTNTGIMAMNLALIMNARRVYLLGYDYKYRGEQMHFYENKEHHNRYKEDKFVKKLDKMLHFCNYKDRFINLNPDSNLNLFTKKHLRSVL